MTIQRQGIDTTAERRKGVMERSIESVASGLGNGVGWFAETGVLFAILTVVFLVLALTGTFPKRPQKLPAPAAARTTS